MTERQQTGSYQKLAQLQRKLLEEGYKKLEPLPRTSQNAERAKSAFEDEVNNTFTRLMRTVSTTSNKTEMTFWSRYDAVSNHKGNTDHWTKLKQRAVQRKSLSNPDAIGTPITLDGKHTRQPYGRVQNISEKLFDDFVLDALQGNIPGTYMYTRPRNSPSRESLRNTFHDRAKEGFRYWLIERPKPTNFGKYGIGSYKTVLGVGNAPRT